MEQSVYTAENVQRYRRSELAEESKVGDCLVLYHRDSRTALALNATGSWIWALLEGGQSVGQVSARLQTRYPSLAALQAESDVRDYLASLTAHGMVIADE